jgi:UDP-GlcNAc:undecaprenyl-phosphate/decaprenyl-phosphate GlcNAc-1-phosphate transferase
MMLFLTAFIVCAFLIPAIIKIANKYGLVDDPKKRNHPAHTHVGIVPRAGGVAIYFSILLTVILFLPFSVQLLGILVAGGLAVAVGVWDDYHDVSPYIRLITNGIVAALVVGAGIDIPYVTNPLGGILHLDTFQLMIAGINFPVVSSLAAMAWIMWMMNAIGWSAGVDGQLPGFVVIACVVISIALITAGAFAGFLPWNFYPQKIMPGYGGKSLAGFLLAVLTILSSTKVGTALLVLSIPLVDAGYTILRRIIKRKSPFRADRGHLHHLLLDRGWGKRKIALFYWGVTAFMGAVALSLNSQGKVFAFIIVALGIGSALMLLSALRKPFKKS